MKVGKVTPFDLTRPDDSNRSEGVHVSQVLKWILIHLDPETYGRDITPETLKLFALGFAVEEAISDALVRRYEVASSSLIVQMEHELDGIYGTPDAFSLKLWRLFEYKYTRISSNRDITDIKFRHWIWQVKAYLKMLGMTEVDIIAIHAMGDYSDNNQVEPLRYPLSFTQREIDRNWDMILRNRDDMMEAV